MLLLAICLPLLAGGLFAVSGRFLGGVYSPRVLNCCNVFSILIFGSFLVRALVWQEAYRVGLGRFFLVDFLSSG